MKNQLKKSLSLLMAVLMILSCWVWIAPDKAEAAAGDYYVRVRVENRDNANGGSDAKLIVKYKPNNGTGTEVSTEINIKSEMASGEGSNITKDFTLPGFPTSVQLACIGSQGITWQNCDGTLNGVFVGSSSSNLTQIWGVNSAISGSENNMYSADGTGGWGSPSWDYSDPAYMGDGLAGSINWKTPALQFSAPTLGEETVTLNKLPSGENTTVSCTVGSAKDQYGVTWYKAPSISLRVDEGVTLNGEASISGSTITVTPDFQTLYPNNSNAKIYVDATIDKVTKTATLIVNFPKYTITFDANGGTIGQDGTPDTDGVITLPNDEKYYQSVIGKAPDYHAREGFEFKGYYSDQNDAVTGKDFTPSGTKFEDNVTRVGASGDSTWYAAWQALPITATFVTADNQLIGTVEGRYDNYLTNDNMYKDLGGLNATVKAAYTGSTVKFNGNNEPFYTDGATNYIFDGWKIIKAYDESLVDMRIVGEAQDANVILKGDVTFQAIYRKADAAKYSVKFYDGNGNVINDASNKSDYSFRDDVILPSTEPTKAQDDKYQYDFIGWAKNIGANFYAVDEENKNADGAVISYTEKEAAEFTVRGDASYVPVFRMVLREYDVVYKYFVSNETGGAEGVAATKTIEGYHWHDSVKNPEIDDSYTAGGKRHYLTGWKLEGADDSTAKADISEFIVDENVLDSGTLTLVAVYGRFETAKHIVEFLDKDGNTVEKKEEIVPGSTITVPEIDEEIDTEAVLYRFYGWKNLRSNDIIRTENIVVNADATYQAVYDEKVYVDLHFYNYDGTLIYETAGKGNSLFEGDPIPAFTGETPVKPEDAVGTYKFTGWADSQGNPVVPGTDEFTGDTYLTAQFETVYTEYTVKFVNESAVVSEAKYHYGQEIAIPANPTKAADVEYIYDFRAWSPDVSEVCYGEVTYEATYRRTPQYYKVTWLNDAKNVHTEGNYQYNAKIQQAVINSPVNYRPAGEGKTWAFKHWVQCDANGNDIIVDGEQVIFTRGQRMGAEHLYFYPVFEEVDNVLTVTFYKEDGTTLLGEAKIPYGGNLADYAEAFAQKAPKLSDKTYHYIINDWVNIDTDATVTTITADVSVKATYTAEAHNKQIYEIVAEPTCNVPGYGHLRCVDEDGRIVDECTEIDYNVPIAPIADDGAPTGQVYVGENKWTLENYKAGIKYEDIKYVGPNTNVIVNAEDTGTRSMPWNVEGSKSRGVGKIEYYVANDKIDDTSTITEWTEVYNYEQWRQEALEVVLKEYKITLVDYNGYIRGDVEQQMKKAEIDRAVDALLSVYNANATGVLSNLNLENGKTYVIYIKVSDREGNGEVNSCIFSSGTISYGSTAAEITVSGEGYGTKFCAEATISIADDTDGYKLYIDGVEAALTDGKYVCADKGVHTATVVDKHGNKTTKTFEIKGSHEYRNYTTAATCENDGSRYDLCTVCGSKANETDIPALGHSYTVNYIDKAPDCINDGYRTYVCDNNCGTKLVLKPTDDAATLAQAKVYAEPAEGEDEGEWVDLKADDLKHLKATGEHTYAMVKDENGEDTAEYVWVIDKEATCSVTGSKHRDCTVCGIAAARVTEVIPLDKENGHKFYREKVTLEPTCTTEGERTKTCRYCGEKVVVEKLPALGHTAGEYRVITAATCEEKGSKILTCSVCGEDIGEAGEDAEGNAIFTGDEVEIPALGHAWKLEGVPFKDYKLDEDGQVVTDENGEAVQVWYQKYVCANDATHTKNEVLEDYVEPVKAKVTFKNGEDNFKEIEGYVSDVITAAQVADKPTKAEDATYKYTFSHWADKDGKEVKFPVTVTGDATYTAVYTEKYVNYTITYYKDDGTTEFKKVGYLHNGDEVALVDGPSKAENNLVKYVFAGWKVTTGDKVYTDKVTIDGANINLKATYTEVKKQYAVTYAYSSSNIIHTYTVTAGDPAPDVRKDFEVEKGYDTKYHYEFKEWNRAAQLASVESNIYTTPDFTPVLHTYDHAGGKTLLTAADCTNKAVYTYTCTCGYSYKKAEGEALGHDWGDYVAGEDGTSVRTCNRCQAKDKNTTTFTIKFFKNAEDTEDLKTISYIPWNTTIAATRLPAAPSKESDSTYDYKFAGWIVKGDATETVVDFTKLAITKNYEFVAKFDETIRKYSVIFAYDAKNTIQISTEVPAGESVKFEGSIPVKGCDVNYHYTFSGWEGYEGTAHDITVTSVQCDLYILAKFDKAPHTFTSYELAAATCTNGTGTRYYCDCDGNGEFTEKVNGNFVDYYYDVTGKPLDHKYKEITRVEATPDRDGYVKYVCETCGATAEETLKYNDNTIEVKVYAEHNGKPASGIKVEIRSLSTGAAVYGTTNANGIAIFRVDKDDAYQCYANETLITLTTVANGNLEGVYSYTDQANCTCACHRNNVWGAIFRFFHKIIKLFTGEFKCCGNPDPMYG